MTTNWVSLIWGGLAGACLMVALIHGVIWCRNRRPGIRRRGFRSGSPGLGHGEKGSLTETRVLDLNEIVNQVLVLLKSEISGRHREVIVNLDPSLPPVRASRAKLQQVLINLIINGLDATMNEDSPPPLRISSARLNDQVTLFLRET